MQTNFTKIQIRNLLFLLFLVFFGLLNQNSVNACTVNASFTVQLDTLKKQIYISNASTNATNYIWVFGDGTSPDYSASPVHTYSDFGVYTIILMAEDTTKSNCFDSTSITIGIPGCKLKPNFTYNLNGTTLDIFNSSEYYPSGTTETHWTFGDGNSSTSFSPSHIYSSGSGTNFDLFLTMRDTSFNNCVDTLYTTININTSCDTTNFNILMNSHFNYDFVPLDTLGYRYQWYASDGLWSNDVKPNHTFKNNGTYNIYLIFRKDRFRNCIDTSYKNITLNGCFVEAYFSVLRDTNSNFSGIINNYSNTARPSKTTTTWYFGDGDSSNSVSPTHTYPSMGKYNLCLKLVDSICASTYCDSIEFDANGQMLFMPFAIKVENKGNLLRIDDSVLEKSRFVVFPNPSNGSFSIEGIDKLTQYIIYSISGQVMQMGYLDYENKTINITDLASGMYHVLLLNENGSAGVKVMKN
jgi:PKD repeat protein